jgi:ferredoxin
MTMEAVQSGIRNNNYYGNNKTTFTASTSSSSLIRRRTNNTETSSDQKNGNKINTNNTDMRRRRRSNNKLVVVLKATTTEDDNDNNKNNDKNNSNREENFFSKAEKFLEKRGLSMGPIALSLQEDAEKMKVNDNKNKNGSRGKEDEDKEGFVFDSRKAIKDIMIDRKSIATISTKEWQKKYVKTDGTVDLFLEDDFNIASRKAGAGDFDTLLNVENIAWSNKATKEVDAPIRNIKITDHETGEILELEVPEGRYILFEAEQQGWELPNACRMGCCTKCAVKVTKGNLEQIEALGVSKEMRDEGYALLCVAHATSDIECITQDEEEVYMKQFGDVFGKLATDKNAKSVVRDDFALEIADMDE